MDRKNFLKTTFAGAAATLLPLQYFSSEKKESHTRKQKFEIWMWQRPDLKETELQIKEKYSRYKDMGIKGLFLEDYSPKHFQTGKKLGLEMHRWMWTMNTNETELIKTHPEYYAVSRSGKSCATEPPYVGYYRFLCPSHPDVPKYLEDKAREQLEKEDVDGLQLDYIRYPDVILPVNLWEHYGLVQTSELPDFDFCYSKYSKDAFLKETGIDIDKLQYPTVSDSWKRFRYNQINKIVNRICELGKEYKKPVSAAVFPTPDIAKRIVRQDWTNWNLDAVFPMVYYGFYREPVGWVATAVKEGVEALRHKFPLYAGFYMPDFNNSPEEFEKAIRLAKENGAKGISLFDNIDNEDFVSILRNLQ